ncbi:hypothetical protein RF11_04620 [Thelohanellus kitauei]|uniref:Uncharacterized protein n=1 Tax=Thelohanellus kitauei TaxID=669202 RepID=A0A0C2N5I2_THEKT|nr:hypothetical protein RF11_04620 [Thelohanellus kitauei]
MNSLRDHCKTRLVCRYTRVLIPLFRTYHSFTTQDFYNESQYENDIRAVTTKNRFPPVNLENMTDDVEQAIIRELNAHSPTERLNCFFFQLHRNIFRKIQQNSDILNKFRRLIEFEVYIKMILLIAFVPIPSVTFAFDLVRNVPYVNYNRKYFRDILENFENNYICLKYLMGREHLPCFQLQYGMYNKLQ